MHSRGVQARRKRRGWWTSAPPNKFVYFVSEKVGTAKVLEMKIGTHIYSRKLPEQSGAFSNDLKGVDMNNFLEGEPPDPIFAASLTPFFSLSPNMNLPPTGLLLFQYLFPSSAVSVFWQLFFDDNGR